LMVIVSLPSWSNSRKMSRIAVNPKKKKLWEFVRNFANVCSHRLFDRLIIQPAAPENNAQNSRMRQCDFILLKLVLVSMWMVCMQLAQTTLKLFMPFYGTIPQSMQNDSHEIMLQLIM
jgi:hypothetical protein